MQGLYPRHGAEARPVVAAPPQAAWSLAAPSVVLLFTLSLLVGGLLLPHLLSPPSHGSVPDQVVHIASEPAPLTLPIVDLSSTVVLPPAVEQDVLPATAGQPEFILTGIVIDEGASLALLNDRALQVGDRVCGAEVAVITPTRVILRRGTTLYTLRLER